MKNVTQTLLLLCFSIVAVPVSYAADAVRFIEPFISYDHNFAIPAGNTWQFKVHNFKNDVKVSITGTYMRIDVGYTYGDTTATPSTLFLLDDCKDVFWDILNAAERTCTLHAPSVPPSIPDGDVTLHFSVANYLYTQPENFFNLKVQEVPYSNPVTSGVILTAPLANPYVVSAGMLQSQTWQYKVKNFRNDIEISITGDYLRIDAGYSYGDTTANPSELYLLDYCKDVFWDTMNPNKRTCTLKAPRPEDIDADTPDGDVTLHFAVMNQKYTYPASYNNFVLEIKEIPSQIAEEDPCEKARKMLETSSLGSPQAVIDPVDTATGSQFLNHNLLTVQGVLPLVASINYDSLLLGSSALGTGWTINRYDANLLESPVSGDVIVYWSTNYASRFNSNADGSYTSPNIGCTLDILIKDENGDFALERNNKSIYNFNVTPQATSLFNRRKLGSQTNAKGQTINLSYDAEDRISQVTEPVSGVFLSYSYNADGLLASITDNSGRQATFTYDTEQRLSTVTDAAGQTTSYTYNTRGQTLTGTNHEGVTFFSNTYGDYARIISQDDTLTTNQPAQFTYDESQTDRIITTFTDRNGQASIYTYDTDKNLLSYQDAEGNITTHTYNADSKRLSTTDANGNITLFEYDTDSNLIKITDAKGGITAMTYDANGNMLSVTDALGKTTAFEYDANNNLTKHIDALGNITTYTYNANGQVLTITAPDGGITTYTYASGRPVTITSPEGNTETLAYDAAGRVVSRTDGDGNTTSYQYDGMNRVTAVSDALNRTISMSYDSRDNIKSLTDAKGNVTTYDYDGDGNLISQTNALNQTVTYEYDGEGRLTKTTDARGNSSELAYDAKGRLLGVMDALGNMHYVAYDAVDNVVTETDALLRTVATRSYDELGNPLSVSDALGNTSQSQYDALSRVTQVTDPTNFSTAFQHDALDRLVGSTDAKGGQSGQDFDVAGNRNQLTDANHNATGFVFDKNGRLVQENVAGGTLSYTYNARDLLASITNARNQQRSFTYDAVGRLTSMTDPDGTLTYTYDANDNVFTVTDAPATAPATGSGGVITREYDALDRVTKYTDAQGNVLQYAYDAAGNLTALTYPDGKQVNYAYDAADRLLSVTDWGGRVTTYSYDANGRVTQVQRPNSTVLTAQYDAAGQLLQHKDAHTDGTVIRQYDFTYNPAGDITRESVQPAPQLYPFTSAAMTYGDGNRLATYNGTAVTYDADGNMVGGPLSGAMASYAFDSRNRLVQADSTQYAFDAENHRVAVTDGSGETRYTVNPLPALSQTLVRTVPDGTKTYYVYGLGLVGEETGGVYRAYHFDLRGSTVALSDTGGQVVQEFQYFPYGGLAGQSPAQVDTPFLYNGRDGVMSDDNGLYYMRARFYNPEIRRFVNRDVLLGDVVDGLSLNRYAYVSGEPASFVDPFGLEKISFSLPTRYRMVMKTIENMDSKKYKYGSPVVINGKIYNPTDVYSRFLGNSNNYTANLKYLGSVTANCYETFLDTGLDEGLLTAEWVKNALKGDVWKELGAYNSLKYTSGEDVTGKLVFFTMEGSKVPVHVALGTGNSGSVYSNWDRPGLNSGGIQLTTIDVLVKEAELLSQANGRKVNVTVGVKAPWEE